jgi:hypothetical protein
MDSCKVKGEGGMYILYLSNIQKRINSWECDPVISGAGFVKKKGGVFS